MIVYCLALGRDMRIPDDLQKQDWFYKHYFNNETENGKHIFKLNCTFVVRKTAKKQNRFSLDMAHFVLYIQVHEDYLPRVTQFVAPIFLGTLFNKLISNSILLVSQYLAPQCFFKCKVKDV